MFTAHGWIAILVTVAVFVVLQIRRGVPVDLLFLGAMVAVTVTGVIDPNQALAGFSNPAVIMIGSLLIVAAGLNSTGVLDWIGQKLIGGVESTGGALMRLAVALVGTSVFLLNTALVAISVPVVVDWCRRREISPSRLLIPVSYLTILGGVCSLIGTSTTLIVNGMLKERYERRTAQMATLDVETTAVDLDQSVTGDEPDPEARERAARFAEGVKPMGLFEIGRVGLPCAIVGAVVLLTIGWRLLPDRTEMVEQLQEHRREYVVEMLVKPECRLIGKAVEAAGLRELPGLFLVEIDRDGDIVTPVSPDDVIRVGDRLVFAGVVDTIVDLEKIPGLVPATDSVFGETYGEDHRRYWTEAVLSRSSPLIGTTVKAANFRRRYNAAVIAVHRNGERVSSKIGDIELEPGDTILLQTRDQFVAQHRNNPDFYLVSSVDGYSPRRHDRATLAGSLGLLLIGFLVLANLEIVRQSVPTLGLTSSQTIIAIAVAGLMIVTRCVSISDARASLNLQVLLTIVGALALGKALEQSGAAADVATLIVQTLGDHPMVLLIAIYVLGMIFTELITNNAVATILLPLAISVAEETQVSPRPFVMAVALSVSLAFLTPIGYQTNLMVMGPGGYRPRDYIVAGFPVALAVAMTAWILIPLAWPF